MKTKNLFAAVVCCASLVMATEASAKSFRVNYDTRAHADFQDLNAAMSSNLVSNGDTLYMDKGCTITTAQTVNKQVTIIGPGYFIGENDADEAYLSNDLYLEEDGIKITGLHTTNIYVRAENVVIERCRVVGTIYGNESSNYPNDNASIRSCFINGQVRGYGTSGALGWNIVNNIIYNNYTIKYAGWMPLYYFSQALIDHNILRFNNGYGAGDFESTIFSVTNSTITNNIITQEYYSNSNYAIGNYNLSDNNTISNNILSGPSYSAYPNNNFSQSTGTIFTIDYDDEKSKRDEYYVLKDDSPAKNYATDGGDCGPFSGAYPYVMSGYPLYVPRFESVNIPSSPTNGKLRVTLTVKNQNE